MSRTFRGRPSRGKDLCMKSYSTKDLNSMTYGWSKIDKQLYRKKEKAVLKMELIKLMNEKG